MRIKILGEVTPESICAAIEVARSKYLSAGVSVQFNNANLYLSAINENGEPIDLVDDENNSLVVTLHTPHGFLSKATTNGESKGKHETESHAPSIHAGSSSVEHDELHAMLCEHQLNYKKNMEAFNRADEVTRRLIEVVPDQFAQMLNDEVAASWNLHQPVEPHGPNKGQPKSMPWFEIKESNLYVHSHTMRKPLKISNPIGRFDPHTVFSPTWSNPAWKYAVERFLPQMLELYDLSQRAPIE
ncbi:hypothetical protein VQ574_21145 (plasmid) [Stutzerimonas frequens]|uniref:hypothetical protein n=1 Tax=Stutzerimonas frequens TaxID=2968969 RepID=UPI002DBB205C|nr:hypothetical protein [Stutzerimonas frequens]WRW29446.1 hypothetical protein VQ574_21145 [Stutzerimonas frequens]